MDSVFDDRELAFFEAHKIAEGSRYSGVKIIEENYDEATNLTTIRTLFRRGVTKTAKSKQHVAMAERARRRTSTGRDPGRKRRAKPKKKQSSVLIPALVLVLLLMCGLALLFGIQYLSSIG